MGSIDDAGAMRARPRPRARHALSTCRQLAWLLAAVAGCGQSPPEASEPNGPQDASDAPAQSDGSAVPTSPTSDAGPDADTGTTMTDPPVRTPAVDCDSPQLRVLRRSGWPGGGVQLALQLRDADGAPRSAFDAEPLVLTGPDDAGIDVEVEPAAQDVGLTGLVIVPSDRQQEHARRLAAARALVEALPAAERIVVWVGVEALPLAAELSERRAHVLARIAAIAPQPVAPVSSEALTALAARLARVEGPAGPIGRTLVIVGELVLAEPVEGAASGLGGDPWQSIVRASLTAAADARLGLDSAADAAYWGGGVEPEDAAGQLAEHIAALRAHTVLVGACGPFAPNTALSLAYGEAHCALRTLAPPPHMRNAPCVAGDAARDAYPYPTLIELQMTEEELALHDQYDAEKDEDPFTLRVAFDGAEPIEASAHFRGQSALDCARKNYSVNLEGGDARRLMPGAANDEFYLISMCNEPYYIYQVLASRMMQKLGLYPLEQRYVRLRVAGRDRGVYLMLEEPDETLVKDQVDLATVVRRRLDADAREPELKYRTPTWRPKRRKPGSATTLR